MWVFASSISAASFLILLFRGRRIAKAIDRWEVLVLKPLSISYIAFSIAFAIQRLWLPATSCAVAWLLNGLIGASLHPHQGIRQLAQATIQTMDRDGVAELSYDESFFIAKNLVRTAFIFSSALTAVILSRGMKWYVSIPAGFFFGYTSLSAFTLLMLSRAKRANRWFLLWAGRGV